MILWYHSLHRGECRWPILTHKQLLISHFSVLCFLSVLEGIKNKYLTYVRIGANDINIIFHTHKSTLISLSPPSLCSHILCFVSWKCTRQVFCTLFFRSKALCLWVTQNRMTIYQMIAFLPKVAQKWNLEEDRSVRFLWELSLIQMYLIYGWWLNPQRCMPLSVGYESI